MYQEKENTVRIRDYDSKGNLTFDATIPIDLLWDYYYTVIVLMGEFEVLSLLLALDRQIRKLNEKYNKEGTCPYCKYTGIYYVYPMKREITCRKCRSKLYILSSR